MWEGITGDPVSKVPTTCFALRLSPVLFFDRWEAVAAEREQAEVKRSEGLMLKNVAAPYGVGRKKGNWWKWKSDPKTIDAVLTYAMRGHGRRTNLYTDYTFALWEEDQLVTFAKAYSGLTDAEIKQVDRFAKHLGAFWACTTSKTRIGI